MEVENNLSENTARTRDSHLVSRGGGAAGDSECPRGWALANPGVPPKIFFEKSAKHEIERF